MHWLCCCIQVSYTRTFAARAECWVRRSSRATTHKQMNEWIWVHFTLGALIIAWCDASHSDCWIRCHGAIGGPRCPHYTWSGWKAGDKQETGSGQIIMSKKQEIPSSHLSLLAWDHHPADGVFCLLRIWQNDILDWWNNNNVMLKLQSSLVQMTWGCEADINLLENSNDKYLYFF